MDIYQDIILDHYQHPRNWGTLDDADATTLNNPSCGDSISLSVRLHESCVVDIAFTGKGCAISQASASMLTEYIKGNSKENILAMSQNDVLRLLGIKLSPARLKCALLPLETLKKLLIHSPGDKPRTTNDT